MSGRWTFGLCVAAVNVPAVVGLMGSGLSADPLVPSSRSHLGDLHLVFGSCASSCSWIVCLAGLVLSSSGVRRGDTSDEHLLGAAPIDSAERALGELLGSLILGWSLAVASFPLLATVGVLCIVSPATIGAVFTWLLALSTLTSFAGAWIASSLDRDDRIRRAFRAPAILLALLGAVLIGPIATSGNVELVLDALADLIEAPGANALHNLARVHPEPGFAFAALACAALFVITFFGLYGFRARRRERTPT